MRVCSITNCPKLARSKTWCGMHYHRWKVYGDVNAKVEKREAHGMWNTPEYRTWHNLKRRVDSKKGHAYKHYASRGIKVCDRWRNSFKSFYEDMGPRPEGMTLDRIDNDGDYEPANCRWADWSTQATNKRLSSASSSGYPGVHRHKKARWPSYRWHAQVTVGGKRIRLGYFHLPEDAASVVYALQTQLPD